MWSPATRRVPVRSPSNDTWSQQIGSGFVTDGNRQLAIGNIIILLTAVVADCPDLQGSNKMFLMFAR